METKEQREDRWRGVLHPLGLAPPPGARGCERLDDAVAREHGGAWVELGATRYAAPVRAAIAALHAAGVCHGDLHRGNIVVVEGRAQFIDFERTAYVSRLRPGAREFAEALESVEPWAYGQPSTAAGLLAAERVLPFVYRFQTGRPEDRQK